MSEDQNTQAVVDETKASAQPDVTVDNARDQDADLDTLLKEFETSGAGATTQTQPEQKTGADDETDVAKRLQELESRQKQWEAEQNEAKIKQEVDALVANIRGDSNVSDRIIRGWIDQRARENPKLGDIYFRGSAKERERLTATMAREFHKEFSGSSVDGRATEDREAVTAAVRGASTKAPEGKAPDYSKMTDAEFAKEKEKLGL